MYIVKLVCDGKVICERTFKTKRKADEWIGSLSLAYDLCEDNFIVEVLE